MGLARKRRNKPRRLPGRHIAIGLLVGMTVVAGCLMAPRPAAREHVAPTARVRLMTRAESVDLLIDGRPSTITASHVQKTIEYGSQHGEPVGVGGRRYHGVVRLVPIVPGQTFDVINVVTFEEYVEGVVPCEALSKWPAETLKAQAIASRTFAAFQIQDRRGRDTHFDLEAGTRSQVYGGVDAETAATNAAVQATRGIVLADGPRGREKIFSAYFSAVCGGVTANGTDFIGDPTPALRAHVSDGCADAPRYRWGDFSISKDELTRRIRIWGQRNDHSIQNLDRLATIEVTARNELGRPTQFTVTDLAGRRYVLKAEPMRNALNAGGPKKVQFLSSHFTPVDAGDSLRITDGRGWGHGVGFCQWCAAGWAKRGMTAKQMLAISYPGAVLVRAW